MKRIPIPYFLIVAVAAMLWLPWLLAKGMFMDGIYNAILAQNLAHGISTFWAPQTNDYSNPAYWNNPPFSMLTLGCCYKILGNQYEVDKIYSLACAIIQLLFLAWAWRIFWRNENEIRKYAWLPCLLWLVSPLTGWCYSNNLMENTMSIFTTLSLIMFLLFLRNKKYLLSYAFSGASCIFLACLTKGPTGLFPLAIPIFFVWDKKVVTWKNMFTYFFVQLGFFVLLFALVFYQSAPANFLHQYIMLRLGPAISLTAKSETETNIIFKETFIMLLPFFILYFGSFFIGLKKNEPNKNRNIAKAINFILSGLAASLPISFSAVQRKFYLLSSLPLFALGFSILVLPGIKFIEQRFENYISGRISAVIKLGCALIVFACVFLSIHNRNSFARDKQMLSDIEQMLPLIGNEQAICADWQLYGEWLQRAYCTRYYNKRMYMPNKILETKFYMTKPGLRGDRLPSDALKIYSGSTFDLYQI